MLTVECQIANLKKSLRNVAFGKAFVLQGGTLSCLNP
jgi:3-deoxy-D-arabino-heptulosonate 7-phosphate (DAHP) synthase class II